MLFNTSGDHGSVAHPCLLCQRVPGAATLHPQSTTSAPLGAPTGRHGLQGLSEGLTPTVSVLNKWGTPSLNDSHPALTHPLSPSRPQHIKQKGVPATHPGQSGKVARPSRDEPRHIVPRQATPLDATSDNTSVTSRTKLACRCLFLHLFLP